MSVPNTPLQDRRAAEQMTVEELRREYVALHVLQHAMHAEASSLTSKIEALRGESVRLQQNAEVEEEHAANQLFRRLDGAERDVRKYQLLLKEEEEATSALRRQIHEVRGQQSEVESQLEQQEEYLLVQLQKKLLDVASKKTELERELQAERQRYLEVLVNQLALLRRGGERATSAADTGSNTAPEEAAPIATTTTATVSASSPTDTAAHMRVVELEQRLNRLLSQHARAMQESAETENRCVELSQRLTDIQNATFLDRARAAKLKEELKEARSKLTDLEVAGGEGSLSCEEASSMSTPSRSLDTSALSFNASQSLKERTKGLLSAAPPPLSS